MAAISPGAIACDTTASTSPIPEATSASNSTPITGARIAVVTTTSVLADLARNVGGDLVEVRSIVPPGADVHSFQTTPSDSVAIGKSEVIISNGFGLDGFLDPLLANNKQPGAVLVVAAQGLNAQAVAEGPIPGVREADGRHDAELVEEVDQFIHQEEAGEIPADAALAGIRQLLDRHQHEAGAHSGRENDVGEKSLEEGLMDLVQETEEGKMSTPSALAAMEDLTQKHRGNASGHHHSSGDPHFWLDPILAIHYVERIRDGLAQADPENAPVYSGSAGRYIQILRDLDQEIARTLGQVPPEHRRMVTFHDAFGYFARRYGWKVSYFEPSDASSVTPAAIERIILQVQSEGIPAIFAEPQFRPDVLVQAAKDTGINVGIVRSLCDSTAPTYVQLMRTNAESLLENLR